MNTYTTTQSHRTRFGLLVIALIVGLFASTSPAVFAKEKDKAPARVPEYTVKGHITLGPVCAIATYPATGDCGDQPYATTIFFVSANGSVIRAATSTAPKGKYKVKLPAGTYTVQKSAPIDPGSVQIIPHTFPYLLTVGPVIVGKTHGDKKIVYDIEFDSGIR